MPSPLLVPYLKPLPRPDQLYRLSLEDFLGGLKRVHATVSSAVKSHPQLQIVQFDQRRQLDWIISEVASEAEQMAIDSYFFTTLPRVDACNGAVRVVDDLRGLL